MRDPSIHIKSSDLLRILEEVGYDISKKDIYEILSLARKVSCDERLVTITNDKVKKDIAKKLTSSKGDAMLLADIIYSVRIKLKHRGISKIKENDREWLQLKELTKLVNQFCDEFQLPKRAGYIKYIETCFPKINSFRGYVSKFINMYESISTEYDSVNILLNDKSPKETKEIHDIFVSKVADKTGILESYTNKPLKMLAFYRVKEVCNELGVEPGIFIDAQFDALDWCSGLPAPESLYGDKAKERLNKYLYQYKITAKPKVSKDFWVGLKNRQS